MKLWEKGVKPKKEIENFTVGNDYLLDQKLVYSDCLTNIAHAKTLVKSKILTDSEFKKLKNELKKILKLAEKDNFKIKQSDEDVHTAIENHLTKKLGKLGKKIHAARSRNDQVITDTRLYTKYKLLKIEENLIELALSLLNLAKKHEFTPIPGYTHMQKAMPSSIGLWADSFIEGIIEDFGVLDKAYQVNDKSPLGSAAGYGSSFNIDKQYTAKLLGFDGTDHTVLYSQNSRGKKELNVLNALNNILLDINKLATDITMFTMDEFKYMSLPEQFTTGSSIMPQKKNYDVTELLKAKSSIMQGYITQLNSLTQNLMSGYNRNFQLTKEPLMNGLDLAEETIAITNLVVKNLNINKENCIKACTPELFATDYAYDLVKQGAAFRDAYKITGKNLKMLKAVDPVKNIKSKKMMGATGNLQLDKADKVINKIKTNFKKKNVKFYSTIKKLIA